MGRAQKIWAIKRREVLKEILGNKCAHAHKSQCEGVLCFDCIEPRGERHHKFDTSQRMSFYWREYRQGNIQLLCEFHNNLKSKTTDLLFYETQPF